jgi:hypothetical protein
MQDFLKIFLVLLVAGLLYYLVFSYYKKKNNMERYTKQNATEKYTNQVANNALVNNNASVNNNALVNNNASINNNASVNNVTNAVNNNTANTQNYLGCQDNDRKFEAYDPVGAGEYQQVGQQDNTANNNAPKDCFPKDQLAPSELLPANTQSQWANVNPNSQGNLGDQNFLSAGYHFGTDTVGQSLRNANRQLRSEPANPQVKVSPWNQTSIEPDINRRPLEIGGC